jgi:hypothetical protein
MKTAGMLAGDGASTTIDNRRQVIQVLSNLTEVELRALAAGGGDLRPFEAIDATSVQQARLPASAEQDD